MKAEIILTLRHKSEFYKLLFKSIDNCAALTPGIYLFDSLWGNKKDVIIEHIIVNTDSPSKYTIVLAFDDFHSKEDVERYYNLAIEHHGWNSHPEDF